MIWAPGWVLEGGRWMSQEEMIEAMGDGDMEAFHLFYQDTARPVYSFILSLTRNPEEAEDVMQDTYLTVWTKAGSYVPQGKPLAWVFTIARNLCYMRFREQKMKADVHWRTWLRMRRGSIALPWNRLRTARCCLTPWPNQPRGASDCTPSRSRRHEAPGSGGGAPDAISYGTVKV